MLTLPSSYQRIGAANDGFRRDPNLGSVIPALGQAGLEPIVIGWDMSRSRPEDWTAVELDERLLPAWFLGPAGAAPATSRVPGRPSTPSWRLDGLAAVPLVIDGVDLAPSLVGALRTSLERTIRGDVHELARVERLVQELAPAAILLTQEGHRTPWLLGRGQGGVRTFAVQHGVLYASHPGYADRRHPALILPTCTFVFGEYERDVLVHGAYRPEEVVVSGVPAARPGRHGRRASEPRSRAGGRARGARGHRRRPDAGGLDRPHAVRAPVAPRAHARGVSRRSAAGRPRRLQAAPGRAGRGTVSRAARGSRTGGRVRRPPIAVVKDIDLYRLLRAADAHLGLNSTVLTDAVATGTCNLIAMVEAHGDLIGYVAAGVAQPIHDLAELRAALRDPRPPEPAARRAFLDEHFVLAMRATGSPRPSRRRCVGRPAIAVAVGAP